MTGRLYILLLILIGSRFNSTASAELIYATDGASDLIRVYDRTGTELSSISNPVLNFPTLLEGFNSGQYFVTDVNFVGPGGPDLVKMDLNGNVIARTTTQDIFGETGGGIVDVINSGRDTFFITSTQNTQVAEVDANLDLIRRFSSGASKYGLKTLGGAVTNDGTQLYVADADYQSGNGFIRIFDTSTGAQVDTISDSSIECPVMMHFSAEGDLFLTDRGKSFTEDRILVFSEDNILQNEFSSGAPVHYNFDSFDLDSAGNLVILETNFPTRSPIRILAQDGTFISEFGDGLQNPHGILAMTTVPEPSSLWTFATGSLALLGFYRRTKTR